jgi:uncharacterized membrane protein YhaH (DUF805 family)
MHWYLDVLKKYAVFDGRASREEFWMYVLFTFIILVVLSLINHNGLLMGIYSLATLLPSLGVEIRRLHDTNRTGWWLLINLIPAIGPLVIFVLCVLPGDAAANDYGPPPAAAPATPAAAE